MKEEEIKKSAEYLNGFFDGSHKMKEIYEKGCDSSGYKFGVYDPNIEVSEAEKIEALDYAYDLDSYMEGAGPNINDVANGYCGGLVAQKEKDKIKYLVYPLAKNTNDKIRSYIANNFIADTVVHTDVNAIVHAMEEGVRLGREEYKNDMLKNAIECKVLWHDGMYLDYTQEQQDELLEKIGVNVNDKVKVIIIKE